MNGEPASDVQWLMIGCGAFAHRYHVPALNADPALRICAIFDPSPSQPTRDLARRHDAPIVDTLDALPATSGLACALVTTPHTLHAAHVDAVLDRNLHVLVDKPFVMTTADARRLAQRAGRCTARQRRRLQPSIRSGMSARARDRARTAGSARSVSCRPCSSATSAPAGSSFPSSAAAGRTRGAQATWPIWCLGSSIARRRGCAAGCAPARRRAATTAASSSSSSTRSSAR